MSSSLPSLRGKITPERSLANLTWLRVGGPADYLVQPADVEDLAEFLRGLPSDIAVLPLGVGSNLIVRDGGVRAVVIKLGRSFGEIDIEDGLVKAAKAGLDLTFMRTIPGSIGGAVRMNAGCYGTYTADFFVEAEVVTRQGEVITLTSKELNFAYRQTDLPEECVITSATFAPPPGDPEELAARMTGQLAKRDATQPPKDLTAGSTFRNQAGYSSTGQPDDSNELKAWKVIDDAGMRGAKRGGAQMSEKHPNFLINTGDATAADLEGLGEDVRKRVFQSSGIELQWEVERVGEPAPSAD